MATSLLLQDWCGQLDVDVHRALLVTGIPEGLGQVDIEAILRPTLVALGSFRLRAVNALSGEKAKAALLEFAEDVDHAAVPREIAGKDGVWTVLYKDRAQDTPVLTQMRRLLLDERPRGASRDRAAPVSAENRAQGAGQEAGKAGPPGGAAKNARRGRRGGRRRTRGHRLTPKGKKRGRGGRRARSESADSSGESVGIVIEEIYPDDLSVDEDQRALYATLQAAAKELIKKWSSRGDPDEGDGPREFLALVTVTDKAKKEELEKELPGTESICLNIKEDRSGVPDLVALLAVRDTAATEESMDNDASGSESLENDIDKEWGDNPEFVAIVAYTDPTDPSAREEMLKIASVIESLGWSNKNEKKDALPQVLNVMSKDTSGTRVKVEEAGRQVDAMVLRKAEEDGNLLECISTLAEPENCPKGKKAPLSLLRGWGEDGEEGGLLELVALLAAQDMVEAVKEEEASRCEGGKCRQAKSSLAEVLALLTSRENLKFNLESLESSEEESEEETEDTESEESSPDESASKKPQAKRARTGSRGAAQARAAAVPAASRARKTRRGGRGRRRSATQEKKAGSGASTEDDAAGNKKKKGSGGAGARARAGDSKGQPPSRPKATGGKKAHPGPRRPPKCR